MQIKSLEQMEKIVSNNQFLSWDGWTVVNSVKSDKARTSKFGAYIKGRWYLQTRFTPSRNGWSIPDKFLKQYE